MSLSLFSLSLSRFFLLFIGWTPLVTYYYLLINFLLSQPQIHKNCIDFVLREETPTHTHTQTRKKQRATQVYARFKLKYIWNSQNKDIDELKKKMKEMQ